MRGRVSNSHTPASNTFSKVRDILYFQSVMNDVRVTIGGGDYVGNLKQNQLALALPIFASSATRISHVNWAVSHVTFQTLFLRSSTLSLCYILLAAGPSLIGKAPPLRCGIYLRFSRYITRLWNYW